WASFSGNRPAPAAPPAWVRPAACRNSRRYRASSASSRAAPASANARPASRRSPRTAGRAPRPAGSRTRSRRFLEADAVACQEGEQRQQGQAEDGEVIAVDAREEMRPQAFELVGADRGQHVLA